MNTKIEIKSVFAALFMDYKQKKKKNQTHCSLHSNFRFKMEYSDGDDDWVRILGKLLSQLQGKSDDQSVKSDLVRMAMYRGLTSKLLDEL